MVSAMAKKRRSDATIEGVLKIFLLSTVRGLLVSHCLMLEREVLHPGQFAISKLGRRGFGILIDLGSIWVGSMKLL
jgi:hypothetical protein